MSVVHKYWSTWSTGTHLCWSLLLIKLQAYSRTSFLPNTAEAFESNHARNFALIQGKCLRPADTRLLGYVVWICSIKDRRPPRGFLFSIGIRVFIQKTDLKNFKKFVEKHLHPSPFFNEVPWPITLLKRDFYRLQLY